MITNTVHLSYNRKHGGKDGEVRTNHDLGSSARRLRWSWPFISLGSFLRIVSTATIDNGNTTIKLEVDRGVLLDVTAQYLVKLVEQYDGEMLLAIPKITVEEPIYEYRCPDPIREMAAA